MKKIIALAVAGAFTAPVMAADVNLSGSVEASYNDTNGTTVTATDTIFTISASTETSTGISVSGDINIASDNDGVAGDGSNSLTLSGPFGSIDAGDTSSAADKYDDRNDYGKLNGVATDAGDAAIGWTLPTVVEGLSVYVSHATDTNADSTAMKHTGVALQYAAGPVSLAIAKNEEEAAESNVSYAGLTVTFQGLAVSVESMEDEAGGTSTKVDEDIVGAKYSMGDVTLFAANSESKTGGTKSAEVSSYGLHYNMGGGVTFFIEASQDDLNDAADKTGAGIVMAF